MKISVLIVAHNEEKEIAQCIESLLIQTRKPDEIVLVNHNSTDETLSIARTYPITVLDYQGPIGSVHARIKGFEVVTGDLVLCIDGDARAESNWVEVLSALLEKENMIMVGSWIRMSGTLYTLLASWFWYFRNPSKGFSATDFVWGASMGLRIDKKTVIRALQESDRLSKELVLPYNPDDYWLALFMSAYGNIKVTNKTSVVASAKEKNSLQGFARSSRAGKVRNIIRKFIFESGIPSLDTN